MAAFVLSKTMVPLTDTIIKGARKIETHTGFKAEQKLYTWADKREKEEHEHPIRYESKKVLKKIISGFLFN